jgi:hypothetical protein
VNRCAIAYRECGWLLDSHCRATRAHRRAIQLGRGRGSMKLSQARILAGG